MVVSRVLRVLARASKEPMPIDTTFPSSRSEERSEAESAEEAEAEEQNGRAGSAAPARPSAGNGAAKAGAGNALPVREVPSAAKVKLKSASGAAIL
jgi:hypothetical protein